MVHRVKLCRQRQITTVQHVVMQQTPWSPQESVSIPDRSFVELWLTIHCCSHLDTVCKVIGLSRRLLMSKHWCAWCHWMQLLQSAGLASFGYEIGRVYRLQQLALQAIAVFECRQSA